MLANTDRVSSVDIFGTIGARLALLRAAATALPDAPESWLKRTFNPRAPSSRYHDFNVEVVDSLAELVTALHGTVASQELRLEQFERDLAELRSEFQERSAAVATEVAQLRQVQGDLRERSAVAETQLTQLGEKINQLSAGHGDLSGELRERIQHLLDEQRVCLRQVSLKISEESVLADRARRATELRLEGLAQRIPEPPA